MSKVLESIVSDAINRVKTPEVQDALQTRIISPILGYVLDALYPYLIAILGLWAAMFLAVVVILICVLRARTIIRIE